MIWALIHGGRVVARGTYGEILDTAEGWRVVERAWHPDGTELAPRLNRAWSIMPEAMVFRAVSVAA